MFSIVAAMAFHWSCDNNDPDRFTGEDHDPAKPVEVFSFEPDSGGLATKVFISGSNFGSDRSKIKVFFNDTPAPVIGSDGNNLFVITPSQPGRENVITVEAHGKTHAFQGKKFLYRTMHVVRTISGRKGTGRFRPGRLIEAEYQYPSTLTVDQNGDVFLSHWRVPYSFIRISEAEDVVEYLEPGSETNTTYAFGAPTVDSKGVVSAISDNGATYFTFDPVEGWSPRQRSIILADPVIQRSTVHSLAAHPVTGDLYTRYYTSGQLIKVDPTSRVASFVCNTVPGSDSYLVFDPVNPDVVYIAYDGVNYIGKVDLTTLEHSIFAGSTTGHQDGPILEARFNRPSQLIVAPDGSLYVADRGNHCIRRIILDSEEGPIVQTVLGKPGVRGYRDGNPEDALFDEPRGVAISPIDGSIYISEWGNNVVRKITIE